jgi:hypothetical protein
VTEEKAVIRKAGSSRVEDERGWREVEVGRRKKGGEEETSDYYHHHHPSHASRGFDGQCMV